MIIHHFNLMNFIKSNIVHIALLIAVVFGIGQIPEQTFGDATTSPFTTAPVSSSGVYAGPDVALVLSASNTARTYAIISNNATTTPPSKVLVCFSQVSACTVANGIALYASSSPLVFTPDTAYSGPIVVRAMASGTNVTITER